MADRFDNSATSKTSSQKEKEILNAEDRRENLERQDEDAIELQKCQQELQHIKDVCALFVLFKIFTLLFFHCNNIKTVKNYLLHFFLIKGLYRTAGQRRRHDR